MAIEHRRWDRCRLDEKRCAQICRMYEDSFPPLERFPFEHMIDSIESGKEFMLTLEEGETVLGFALLRWLTELNMLFLEYIAVDQAMRSQGYGGMILREVLEMAKTRPGILGVILEIESPEDGSEGEKATRMRRVKFYQQYGAELIEDHGAYLMPDFTGLGSMPMKLMWIPASPEDSGYPARDLRAWMIRFYQAGYGRNEGDVFLQQILQRLPGG